ncbi:hypothetical protein BGY98DRAFT_989839 [Russula aff. rugulosa BPL654]|nr:hypothetical protein BGY98DRAFT_989839 [Russula aff. rugulosa BPL654]
MESAEADDAEGLWPLCGAGTKGMGGRGHHPLVWVRVGRCSNLGRGGKQGHGLVIGLGTW